MGPPTEIELETTPRKKSFSKVSVLHRDDAITHRNLRSITHFQSLKNGRKQSNARKGAKTKKVEDEVEEVIIPLRDVKDNIRNEETEEVTGLRYYI